MRAWLFQDSRQKAKLGAKCPWSVGWYDSDGKKRSKKVGAKSTAEKFRKRIQAELALGLVETRKRTKWAAFRVQYLTDVASLRAPQTLRLYKGAFKSFEKIIAPGYVDAIDTKTVDRFIAKRMAQTPKPAPATVNRDLRLLRAAFRRAALWGMTPAAPQVNMLREPERDPYFVDDASFTALYDACEAMKRPRDQPYAPGDWWRGVLVFAYMTGWRIGEILDLRRDDLDLDAATARVDAESTKGRREARIELHPAVIDHCRAVADDQPFAFPWPHHERTLWADFAKLKAAAELDFPGAFHRLRFGFANANVDHLDADVLQKLMRHRDPQTTRRYVNMAERMRRRGTADRLHVPAVLRESGG
ncbi:MAG: tyrosine-type recombinase/integrase [Planctomycetota bacterium]